MYIRGIHETNKAPIRVCVCLSVFYCKARTCASDVQSTGDHCRVKFIFIFFSIFHFYYRAQVYYIGMSRTNTIVLFNLVECMPLMR